MLKRKLSFFLILLAFISIITLYSARSILPSNLDNIFLKQIFFYGISFVIFFSLKSNKIIFKYITFFYVFSIILLLSLLLFTNPINNAKCWFIIPFLGTIQPSEFVKVILIVYTAIILTKKTKLKFLKVLIIFLIPALLTYLEPDTGLVIIYTVGVLGSLFCYSKKYNYLIIISLFLLIALGTILFLYYNNQEILINIFGNSIFLRINRIINWKNQDGYQLNNALIAMGSNGMNFSFNNINTYFPEAQTDFIFASFAASFGYFLTICLLVILLLFDLYLFNIAKNEKNETNKIMIVGFISMIIYQQIQNVGMNIGILPITGITLPFISYGGSSLISYALILTIIKNTKEKRNKIL